MPSAPAAESAQAAQRRFPAMPQIVEDLVHHAVQAVGRFRLGHARLARDAFGDVRLLHSDYNVPAAPPAARALDPRPLP